MFLLAALLATAAGKAAIRHPRMERYSEGGWRLVVAQDRFTGERRCRLKARHGRMLYQPGAVGLHIGGGRGVLGARYRIDGGPALRWQDVYPSLVRAGVSIEGGGMDDPSAGILWLPQADVVSARRIAVQVAPGGHVRMFRIGAFAAMRSMATRLGCSPASFAS